MSDEKPIMTASGYLINVFQKGLVKKLNLYLYPTHLKIENSKTNEIIDDVLLSEISKVKSMRTLGGILVTTSKQKSYKISWKNRDLYVAAYRQYWYVYNAIRGDKQGKEWVNAINQYKQNPLA